LKISALWATVRSLDFSGKPHNIAPKIKVFNNSEEKWSKVEQSGKFISTLALRNNNCDGHIYRRLFMQA
jgi:hypothetical protein